MKNKEIEELLNELKEYASGGMSGLYPSEDTVKNFVSYVEQLEKENEGLKQQENQQLKKQKDDVVEYIKEHIKYECDNAFNGMQFYSYHLYDFNKEELLRMLGEIDD